MNKFRIYDKLNKQYEDVSDIHIDLSSGEIYEVVGVPMKCHLSAGIVSIKNQERYIIEQSTGLHDQNGVEIWQGDIVKTNLSNEGHVIKYDQDVCAFKLGDVSFLDEVDYLEVIGNIHNKKEETK